MAIRNARAVEFENYIFFKMDGIPCDYEKREQADVMPLAEVREGLRSLNMRLSTFYDRPPPTLLSAGGNTAFANGTGAASFVKPGQIMTPIKFLTRLGEKEKGSPVFFVSLKQ